MSPNNELIKKEVSKIISKNEAALQKSVSNSLLSKVKMFSSDTCLLVDISGSMAEHIQDGTKYSCTLGVLENFKETRTFVFSDTCIEVTNKPLPGTQGGTNLGGAFNKMHENKIKHVVLITDGQPDSEEFALRAASGLNIDIIYIGPDPVPEFLKRLGTIGNNKFENVKLIGMNDQKALGAKIKGFLGA